MEIAECPAILARRKEGPDLLAKFVAHRLWLPVDHGLDSRVMKTKNYSTWMALGLSVLLTATGFRATAEEPAKAGKSYTGLVTAVDAKDHSLTVKGTLFSKRFNLGDNCVYTLLNRATAGATDLRAGQKLQVSYQEVHGVLVANRIEQQPMRYEGIVKAIDIDKKSITLRAGGLNREFQIGEDCAVVLRNNRTGTPGDLKPGQRVNVTYDLPEGERMARQIVHASFTFDGVLTAVDLTDRTVKARAAFGTKKFNLARDCSIMRGEQTDGKLRELKPGERFEFTYDEVNGVNIVNRIAPAQAAPEAVTAQTAD